MRLNIIGSGLAVAALLWASGAAAQQSEVNCLDYGQVEAVHQMGERDIVLEVDGGLTLYHLIVEEGCFADEEYDADLRIVGSGADTCMRTTDRVHFGRKQCSIEGFEIIETEEQLEQLLTAGLE